MYDTFAGTIHETTWSMTSVPWLVDHAYQHVHLYSNQYNLHIPLLLSLTVCHLSDHPPQSENSLMPPFLFSPVPALPHSSLAFVYPLRIPSTPSHPYSELISQ